MNEPLVRPAKTSRWLVPALLLASAVPVVAGAYRLAMIVHLFPPSPDASRLSNASPSLALHIVATGIFLVAGAFQLSPQHRERSPRTHRTTGFVTAPAGLLAALSGLWLTATVAPGPYDGPWLNWIRVLVGAAMGLEILVGVAAIGRRSFALHGDWMIRAYALGLGAGTQVITHSALLLVGAAMTTDRRTVAMGAGWLINALVAEWLVRRRRQKLAPRGPCEKRSPAYASFVAGSAVLLASVLAFAGNARAEAPAPGENTPKAVPSASSMPSESPAPSSAATLVSPPAPTPTTVPTPTPTTVSSTPTPPRKTSETPTVPANPTDATRLKESPGSGIVGLRIAHVRSSSTSADANATSVTLGGRLEAHNDETDSATYRGRLDFALGGGTAGLDGAFGGALLVGLRLPVSPHHAPFARIGFGGEIQANPRFLYSRFDLPLTEIGHQYVNDDLLLEVGIRFSPVLTGRFRSNADVRDLSSSLSFGAFATAQLHPLRFDALYTRIPAREGTGRGLDSFQGLGCILPFGDFAFCADAQLVRDDGAGPAGTSSEVLTSGYVGGLLGVGRVNGSSQRR